MSCRRMSTIVMLTAIALGAAGCAQTSAVDDSGEPLTTDVVFAAVKNIDPGDCADDAADAFEVPASAAADAHCVRVDPEDEITLGGGRAVLIAESEDAPSTPESIELHLGDEDAARLGEFTGRLVDRAAPQNQMAIIVDGEVQSTPAVMSELTGGVVSLSGDGLLRLYERMTG